MPLAPLFALLVVGAAAQSPSPPAPPPGPDAGTPAPEEPDDRIARFRKDVFYVVDAFVVRQDRWVVERGADGLPNAERDQRYAVYWDERPVVTEGARIVSEEWAVVDGTGRLLTVAQFGVLSGELADWRPHGGRTYLEGVQRYYDRQEVEALAAERVATAAARYGVPADALDAIRAEVVAGLPEPRWMPLPPAPLG